MISSSVIPFSCFQSFPVSGSFPVSQLFASGGQSTGASAPVLLMSIQGLFLLGLTGLISLQSEGLSSLLQHHNWKASTLSCLALFMAQFSHLYITAGKTIALTIQTFVIYFNKGLKMQNCTKCAIMNKNVQIYTHKMWCGMLDCQYPLNHQKAREFQKNIYFCLTWLRQSLWLCGSQQTVENSLRDGNTRPPDLPLEKSVCGSRSDS